MVVVELSKTSHCTTGRGRERGLLRHQLLPVGRWKTPSQSLFLLVIGLRSRKVEKQAAGHGKRGKGRVAGHAGRQRPTKLSVCCNLPFLSTQGPASDSPSRQPPQLACCAPCLCCLSRIITNCRHCPSSKPSRQQKARRSILPMLPHGDAHRNGFHASNGRLVCTTQIASLTFFLSSNHEHRSARQVHSIQEIISSLDNLCPRS